MKQWLILLMAATTMASAAEHDHSAMQESSTSASAEPAHNHAAMMATMPEMNTASQSVMQTTMREHGGMLNTLLLMDRLEQQHISGDDFLLWGGQAWYGGDYNKLWLKTEGEYNTSIQQTEHAELQALFSRAVAPYWDLQAGLRYVDSNQANRAYAVLGVQGLAPYWFEVDAALFVSERGDLNMRLETSYDLFLTQKLLLQPRLELNQAVSADVAAGVEQGISDSNIGLRLRYEFIREFAPYVGIERSIGKHKGMDDSRFVIGVRFWY